MWLPNFRLSLAVLALVSVASFHPSTPSHFFAVAVQGASPQESLMHESQAVLRLVVSRKPVPYCFYPEREDALNFLGAYVVETLECGHRVHHFFNPPVESLIAKRRRCAECKSNVFDFPARAAPRERKAA
jgi:hypothetical protein